VVLFLMLLSSAVVERYMPGLRLVFDLTMMWAAVAREVLETLVPLGVPVPVPMSVPLGLSRDRRMDSPCPCDPLVMVQASLPRTSAGGHRSRAPSRAEDWRGDQVPGHHNEAERNVGLPAPCLMGAKLGSRMPDRGISESALPNGTKSAARASRCMLNQSNDVALPRTPRQRGCGTSLQLA
jgi:hypothetical protein